MNLRSMEQPIYLDTNVIIRYLTGDDPHKQAASAALFHRIQQKELTVSIPDTVVAECVYVLSSRNLYHKTRTEIRFLLYPILALEGVKLAQRRILLRTLDIYATYQI